MQWLFIIRPSDAMFNIFALLQQWKELYYEYDTGTIELIAYFGATVGGVLKLLICGDAKWVSPEQLINYDLCPPYLSFVESIAEEEPALKGDLMNYSMEYYNQNAVTYYNNTLNIDMSEIYHSFLQHLPRGGLILDAGCGSGRDSLHFINKDYRVVAFDGSEEMVSRGASLIGREVQQCTFDDFQSDQLFHGIWACASLLHVEKEKLKDIIDKLTGYLIIGGIFYMSFKYGNRDYKKDGRTFSCFREKDFTAMIRELNNLKIIELFQTVDAHKDRPGVYWLNCLLKRLN